MSSAKQVPIFDTTVLAYVLVLTVRHVEKSAFLSDQIYVRQKYDERLGDKQEMSIGALAVSVAMIQNYR